MLFNSLEFAIFFPVVVALYFLLRDSWRVPLLLVSSCIFYMAFQPVYILILLITILIDYFAGIYIEKTQGPTRKLLLLISILATCLVLFVFKYYDFVNGNLGILASWLGFNYPLKPMHMLLPIGLSFHTFQSLSYVVEVYRGHQKAERNFTVYSTYVMFFPQLVAGPIERPQNLLHQFYEHHTFDAARVASGLKRMAWGLFKKVVIADRLSLYVNDVYAAPQACTGLQLTIATVFFAYQIYCDFSGYSDMALGSAKVLGFELMENFRTPYYSLSISEFWRRWHISLSTWFKDYLYVPLGGGRVGPVRKALNYLITFGVSGLWHGANWTYIVWGLLNGFYLMVGASTLAARNKAFAAIGMTAESPFRKLTMWTSTIMLTCAGWVVFRAHNMTDAAYILTHWFRGWHFSSLGTEQFLMKQFPVAIASILFLDMAQILSGRINFEASINKLPIVPRWTLYLGCVFIILLFGVYRSNQFIYFQF